MHTTCTLFAYYSYLHIIFTCILLVHCLHTIATCTLYAYYVLVFVQITLPKFGLHQIVVTEVSPCTPPPPPPNQALYTYTHMHTHTYTHTQIIDAGHFWAQFGDMETVKALQTLMDLIKQRNPAPIHYCSPQELVGRYCLARYSEDGFYYRAKVLGIHQFYQHPKLGQPSVSILLAEVRGVNAVAWWGILVASSQSLLPSFFHTYYFRMK